MRRFDPWRQDIAAYPTLLISSSRVNSTNGKCQFDCMDHVQGFPYAATEYEGEIKPRHHSIHSQGASHPFSGWCGTKMPKQKVADTYCPPKAIAAMSSKMVPRAAAPPDGICHVEGPCPDLWWRQCAFGLQLQRVRCAKVAVDRPERRELYNPRILHRRHERTSVRRQ